MGVRYSVADVTRGARGIGRACAGRLRAEGARVVLADVDVPAFAATSRALDPPDRWRAVPRDVSRPGQVEALVPAAFGRLDIIADNAGIVPRSAPA